MFRCILASMVFAFLGGSSAIQRTRDARPFDGQITLKNRQTKTFDAVNTMQLLNGELIIYYFTDIGEAAKFSTLDQVPYLPVGSIRSIAIVAGLTSKEASQVRLSPVLKPFADGNFHDLRRVTIVTRNGQTLSVYAQVGRMEFYGEKDTFWSVRDGNITAVEFK